MDALGRLTKVLELGTLADPRNLETDYKYDYLGNLRRVDQLGAGEGVRTRTFTYDSLSRLVCASNPENSSLANPQGTCPLSDTGSYTAGTVGYSYDPNGNLKIKKSARVTTNYSYDALNRLTWKYANDSTPPSCYTYDTATNGIGRLAAQWTYSPSVSSSCVGSAASSKQNASTTISAYDAVGHVLSAQQCIMRNTCSYNVNGGNSYTYNLAGSLSTYDDGLGANLFTNSYDAAGHLTALTGLGGGNTPNIFSPVYNSNGSLLNLPLVNLFSAGTYNAAGQLSSALYGTGLHINRTYDSRFRITGEVDTGGIITGPARPASVTINILGSELHK